MKFQREYGKPHVPLSLQVINFIDVLLVLVVFLMFSKLGGMASKLDVDLPKAGKTAEQATSTGVITISIDRDGGLTVEGVNYRTEELKERLDRVAALNPNETVLLWADKETDYGIVINVIDICTGCGFKKISFARKAKES